MNSIPQCNHSRGFTFTSHKSKSESKSESEKSQRLTLPPERNGNSNKTRKNNRNRTNKRDNAACEPNAAVQNPSEPLGPSKTIDSKAIAETTFPAPLALPGDVLDPDPDPDHRDPESNADADDDADEPQSFDEWFADEDRNRVTARRRTIYVGAPPGIGEGVGFLAGWTVPDGSKSESTKTPETSNGTKRPDEAKWERQHGREREHENKRPAVEDVMRYLAAFYWPLPVKQLPRFTFTNRAAEEDDTPPPLAKLLSNSEPKPKNQKRKRTDNPDTHTDPSDTDTPSPRYIALQDPSKALTRITTRPSPNEPFTHQLSANDLVDALIECVPPDAYAVLLLLEHDIYEDDADAYMIGRAYGGSRVAVVSSARYNPVLDEGHGVDGGHCWPLSHCVEYGDSLRGRVGWEGTARVKKGGLRVDNERYLDGDEGKAHGKPMRAAIAYALAHNANNTNTNEKNKKKTATDEAAKTWLNRVCRTTSHELGHCFGLEHCVSYACIMQASGSVAEDTRQPGYLCPVDLAKIMEGTGAKSGNGSKSGERERSARLAEVCDGLGPGGGFGALGAWMRAWMGDC